jgi:hypothetical protein
MATGWVSVLRGKYRRHSPPWVQVVTSNVSNGYANFLDCCSTNSVSSKLNVSGMIGFGSPTACFWDIQISGKLDGVGNIDPDLNGIMGKTTAEMQTASTFLIAGWDFVNETKNGTEDI